MPGVLRGTRRALLGGGGGGGALTTSATAQAMPPSLAAEKADDIKQFRATLAALYSDAADDHGVAVSMQFFASVGVKAEEAEDVGRTNLGGMQEGALPV